MIPSRAGKSDESRKEVVRSVQRDEGKRREGWMEGEGEKMRAAEEVAPQKKSQKT